MGRWYIDTLGSEAECAECSCHLDAGDLAVLRRADDAVACSRPCAARADERYDLHCARAMLAQPELCAPRELAWARALDD